MTSWSRTMVAGRISQYLIEIFQDFHGPIINTDHFLYWGRTRRTVDGKMVEFNIIEQTEFLDDVTFSPFNAR